MTENDEKLTKFMALQQKAKQLIQMDMNGELNKYTKYGNKTQTSNIVENKEITSTKIPENIQIKKTSHLPIEILNSFNENNNLNTQENLENNKKNEQIDYNKIEEMIDKSIKKNLATIKKSLLTENNIINSNELQALKIGNKFSFITKNGDLYEANLKFIKNIKKSTN